LYKCNYGFGGRLPFPVFSTNFFLYPPAQSASLCSSLGNKSCTNTISLIDTKANFEKYFKVIQGDHAGTHEHQKYESSQMAYANGTVILTAKPQTPSPCKSNGYFDLQCNVTPDMCNRER
jgi:hypothetical protein